MAVLPLTDAEFATKVETALTPVLVDFFAEWCGPCKAAAPVLEKISTEFAGKVAFYKMDVDANAESPAKFGVMSIPTVILFKDGKELERKVGFGGEQGYKELLQKAE